MSPDQKGPLPSFATCTCRKDIHYAKALIGSVRYFYPAAAVHVLLDDDVSMGDERQLGTMPGVQLYRVGDLVRRHGLPLRGLLTKLNLFFIPTLGQVVFADADSLLVGPLDLRDKSKAALHMFNAEVLDHTLRSNTDAFQRWAIDIDRLVDIQDQPVPEQLIFAQSSHFSVDCRKFPVRLLENMLPMMAPTHEATNVLRAGDQGFFNYLVNFPGAWEGTVSHSADTIQVGHTQHVSAYDKVPYVAATQVKPYTFIHYVGFSRKFLRRRHEYAAALQWGTRLYYERFSAPTFIRDEFQRLKSACERGVKSVASRYQRPRR